MLPFHHRHPTALFATAFALMLAIAGQARGVADDIGARFESARFRVVASNPDIRNLEYFAEMCEEALDRLAPGFQPAWPDQDKILVRVCENGKEFEKRTGQPAHMTFAVALPLRGIMVLNGPPLQAAAPSERFQTVGHEMVHLLLGRLSEGRVHVPYWLHEGLAQLVVGQTPHAGSLRLAWANLRNTRIPMTDLIREFPYGKAAAPLAYAQCASFSRFVATRHFQFNSAKDWFRYLVERPEKARAIFVWAGSRRNVLEQEAAWGNVTRGHTNWLLIITSSTLLWAGIVVLFLIAYRAKRRRESTVMEDWDPWEREDET